MEADNRYAMPTDLIREAAITVVAAVIQVAVQSRARRSIILSNGGSTTITVGTSGQLIAGQGVVVPPNTQPVQIDRCDSAPWVVSALYAIGSGAGGLLGVVEIIDQN